MGTSVLPARFLDGAVMTMFVMTLAALSLYLFGEFWGLTQDPRLSKWNIGLIMRKLFPFKKTFDFNLTHILLFSVCILVMSLRPDYPQLELEREAEKEKKRKGGKGGKRKTRQDSGEREEFAEEEMEEQLGEENLAKEVEGESGSRKHKNK